MIPIDANRSDRRSRQTPAFISLHGGGGNRTRELDRSNISSEWPVYPAVTPYFGGRLASLIDGEGHFEIGRQSKGGFYCAFKLKLRAELLELLRESTGLGYVDDVAASRVDGHNRQPQAVWTVARKADCFRLVAILLDHPLWSKKGRDFDVWCDALAEWLTIQRGGHGQGRRPTDWSRMERLYHEIRAVREFV